MQNTELGVAGEMASVANDVATCIELCGLF